MHKVPRLHGSRLIPVTFSTTPLEILRFGGHHDQGMHCIHGGRVFPPSLTAAVSLGLAIHDACAESISDYHGELSDSLTYGWYFAVNRKLPRNLRLTH